MTDAARDLYLLVAVLGLLPAVALAGLPVLAQSAFVAVGAVGALKLEQAGLPIGGGTSMAGGKAGSCMDTRRRLYRQARNVTWDLAGSDCQRGQG